MTPLNVVKRYNSTQEYDYNDNEGYIVDFKEEYVGRYGLITYRRDFEVGTTEQYEIIAKIVDAFTFKAVRIIKQKGISFKSGEKVTIWVNDCIRLLDKHEVAGWLL